MRLLVQHHTRYAYPKPAALGPHVIRLRPANHTRAHVESYSLRAGDDAHIRWQQDPHGNHLARVTFKEGTRVPHFDVTVELAVDVRPVNPFDFFLDDAAKHVPFAYPPEQAWELAPFLRGDDAGGPLLAEFLDSLPAEGETVSLLVALNAAIGRRVRYVIREEPGIWTPEETLANGRGSCRDSAVLLIAALRSRGLAARFVSGYLVQLTDEGMIPDAPKGVGRDVVDLHAWAEVYLPGGGWIGLDATSGLLCGEGHIPLVCTAVPSLAGPVEGTSDVAADGVTFEMTVGRLGHEARPTAPYSEDVWHALKDAGGRVDSRLRDLGVTLTMGGEPTFNSRETPDAPEWNGAALGPTKWAQGMRLAGELRKRLLPGAAILHRMGKHYPGESLPRWALELFGHASGAPLWADVAGLNSLGGDAGAEKVAGALARQLGVLAGLQAAYEDPWRFLQDEASLPVDVDPLQADLDDSEERRRLARVLDRGLGKPVGWVLPLSWQSSGFVTSAWTFRRGHLFLLQGDSPVGLRLPLKSLSGGDPPLSPVEPVIEPADPRRKLDDAEQRHFATGDAPPSRAAVRTALCVESRQNEVFVFLPPVATLEGFLALLAAVDAARRAAGVDVRLEGYPPPSGAELRRLSVTPDPGVLEVNIPPTLDLAEYGVIMDAVFEAALHSGLHSEKYLVDGRLAGSGGGHHLTLGGPSALESPFLRRPDLMASLLTFFQHHPSLSYLFTGLFVGPTSQAPRIDEARHDALYELEIALERAFDARDAPPWLSDMLFRHLLVDVSGNTHRTEICIDKLFDPQTPHGRQGLLELRAFEMPPHVRMTVAQMTLVRALVAAFASAPYRAPLVRFGLALHDRYLLPTWLWRDFEDVLAFLESRGLALPAGAYRPFLELRCPVAGRLDAGDVVLEVRNAIEPWHVLGEEQGQSGTSRYVDSSMERVEVLAQGLVPGRHVVLVNGHVLPLRPTGRADQHAGGVRFRAWAPPHSLQAHLGIHHPLRFDVVDTWSQRSIGACAYHVWHPEGRGYDTPPLTRFEADARRAQRFTIEGPLPWPVAPVSVTPQPDAPYSLDLRRLGIDRPPPEP